MQKSGFQNQQALAHLNFGVAELKFHSICTFIKKS